MALAATGRHLPGYVEQEFGADFKCGRVEHGFLQERCTACHAERYRAMTWVQRLKHVFRIDIEQCERCGGKLKIIASIEDPAVVRTGRLDTGAGAPGRLISV